jgi:hypothetical protein
VSVVLPEYETYGSRSSRNWQSSSTSTTLVEEDGAKGFRRFLLPLNQPRANQRRSRRRQQLGSGSTKDVLKPSPSSDNLAAVEVGLEALETAEIPEGDLKQLSSSSESSSDSEEEAFVDGFRYATQVFCVL